MANHHGQRPAKAKTSEADRKWLACLIDCEGSINFRVEKRRRKGHIHHGIDISNTSMAVLRQALRIMRVITSHPIPPPYEGNSDRGWRPCWRIRFTAYGAVEDVLRSILPHLIAKKKQAQLMLRFIAISPFRVHGNRLYAHHRDGRRSWTARHYRIVEQVRVLNRRYARGEWAAQRTTERRALRESGDEETVCTRGRPREAAEMTARPADSKRGYQATDDLTRRAGFARSATTALRSIGPSEE